MKRPSKCATSLKQTRLIAPEVEFLGTKHCQLLFCLALLAFIGLSCTLKAKKTSLKYVQFAVFAGAIFCEEKQESPGRLKYILRKKRVWGIFRFPFVTHFMLVSLRKSRSRFDFLVWNAIIPLIRDICKFPHTLFNPFPS